MNRQRNLLGRLAILLAFIALANAADGSGDQTLTVGEIWDIE